MKVVVLYRPESEYSRIVETFIHDFQEQHQAQLDVINVDTRDGVSMALLYDVARYPAILALREDGSLIKSWEGEELPMMDEVAYYAVTTPS
jgi:hypothetical protein